MPAELFGNRFLSNGEPAWHKLGIVSSEPISASSALEQMGSYDVTLEDLFTSSGFHVTHRAIVRHPTPDSPEMVQLGVVGPEYTLISPRDICQIWDAAVRAPVETIGSLFSGSTIFISTKLPTLNIRGDEVTMFLLAISPMSGFEALQARVTGVRVVCSNTLEMAKASSTEVHRVVHDKHASLKLQAALDGVYARAEGRVAKFAELFDLMAGRRLTNDELNIFIESVYTIPIEPDITGLPESVAESRILSWETNSRYYRTRRELAYASFNGDGIGMDTTAAKGTVWGAVNAIAETETHARGGTPQSRAQGILAGYRGQAIEKSFELAERLIK